MSMETYSERGRPAGTAVAGTFESAFSAVSWSAIIAGAAAAAAMAMILVALGAGFGLLAVSPWENEGLSPASLGIGVIVWSIVIHAASFGLGGYLAGRLRTKWSQIHGDEVFFRDTAHGFVSWAIGILASLCIMTTIAGGIAKGTLVAGGAAGMGSAAAMAAGPAVEGGLSRPATAYFSDLFLRPSEAVGAAATDASTGAAGTTSAPTSAPGTMVAPALPPSNAADHAGVEGKIRNVLTMSLANGDISPADKSYLARLVAEETGMNAADAQKRVDDVMAQAKKSIEDAKAKAKSVADEARKATAGAALWAFVAMLVGAFCASYAATIGGRARDL